MRSAISLMQLIAFWISHSGISNFLFWMTDRRISPGKIVRAFAERDSRIRLFNGERRGLTRCLNRGIALAKGHYLARMDANDFAVPDRFKAQVDYLDANPDVLALGGEQAWSLARVGRLANGLFRSSTKRSMPHTSPALQVDSFTRRR